MEGFTIIDGVVAVIIIISAMLAYSRGLVREVLAIGGWIVAGIVAFLFADQAEPLMRELPVVGEFLRDSCELARIAAFAGVFALALIVMSLITPLFASLVQHSALGGIDQGLGFLFGAARGILLVGIALLIYDRVITDQAFPIVDDSRSARVFARMQDKLSDSVPSDAPGWITEQYQKLVGDCVQPAPE
ncbi:MAG: colicin V production CvpA [Rhodobacterales bacterium]|nr:MAG: colicin V production CvpA [Rhodobacterales bacterium]